MTEKSIFCMMRRSVWRNKVETIISVLVTAVVLLSILLVFETKNFLSVAPDKYNSNNIDARSYVLYTDEEVKEEDIIALYKEETYVDMIIRETEYNTTVSYGDTKFHFDLKACSTNSMPQVTNGQQLDLKEKNQVILPEKMIVYDAYGNKEEVDSVAFIGKQIVCTLYKKDYTRALRGDEEDEKNLVTVDLTVTGTYDSDYYFQSPYTAFISPQTAKIIHKGDIHDDITVNVLVMADSVENASEIRELADENYIGYYLTDSYDSKTALLIKLALYLLLFIFIAIWFWISGVLIKTDIEKNAYDYMESTTDARSKDSVMFMLFLKHSIMYITASVVTMFLALAFSDKVSQLLHNVTGKIFMLEFDFKSLLLTMAICIVIMIFNIFDSSLKFFAYADGNIAESSQK